MILFPDGVQVAAAEVTTPGSVNAAANYPTKCTAAQWTALAAKGCVFLPAAGYRNGVAVAGDATQGYYWSASSYTSGGHSAYYLNFQKDNLTPSNNGYRCYGCSVRLVRNL